MGLREPIYSAGQKFRTFHAMNFLSSREARKIFLFKCAKLLTKTVHNVI